METLNVDLSNVGNNFIKLFPKKNLIRSSFLEEKPGFTIFAEIGDTSEDAKWMCISKYYFQLETDSDAHIQSIWAKVIEIQEVLKHKNKVAINRLGLPFNLNAIKVDWAKVLSLPEPQVYENEELSYETRYHKDLVCIVKIEKNKYHENISIVGQWNTKGEDKTADAILHQKRVAYRQLLQKAMGMNMTKELAQKFLESKAQWKWELADILETYVASSIPKDVWLELAEADSHRYFNKRASDWAFEGFQSTSLPRKIAYCKLIADCK